jgi:hypothetical protein
MHPTTTNEEGSLCLDYTGKKNTLGATQMAVVAKKLLLLLQGEMQ